MDRSLHSPSPTRRASPVSIRLSTAQRAQLEREAGDSPLGAHIKRRLFADAPLKAGRRHHPVRDQRTLAQLLAQLGRSELSVSLRDLADAARSGSLDCDAEVRTALLSGCADIQSLRAMLVTALGLKAPRPPQAPTSTPRRAFSLTATGSAVR